MKQVILWMMSAILAISGASVFTACMADNDNPVKPVGIAIDETNFPDSVFRQYLFDDYEFAKDGILTDEEIRSTTKLAIDYDYIESLKGIEFFTALETLWCNDNELTELDLSRNTKLKFLDCSYNHLTKLNISNNTALIYLDCYGNNLTELDVTKNTALVQLDFDFNKLTSIDLSKNLWLEELYCADNELTKLDVSANTKLILIQCYNNKIAGQSMDDLIGCLPHNDTPTYYEFGVIDYSNGVEKEGNVCTKSQVAALKAKGWQPLQWDNEEYEWIEYPGSDD